MPRCPLASSLTARAVNVNLSVRNTSPTTPYSGTARGAFCKPCDGSFSAALALLNATTPGAASDSSLRRLILACEVHFDRWTSLLHQTSIRLVQQLAVGKVGAAPEPPPIHPLVIAAIERSMLAGQLLSRGLAHRASST